MMRLTLEAAGYEVGEASNGVQGLEVYGDGSNWNAVLLDQRMPCMDGLETLRHINERNRAARVIMATAYASIELAVDAMKLGATDFVRKPMTPETLRNAAAAALSKQPQLSAAASSPVQEEASAEPLIQIITMNGFTVVESEGAWQAPNERRFTVESPGGEEHKVLVQIDEGGGGLRGTHDQAATAPRKLILVSAGPTPSERLLMEGRESSSHQKAHC